MLLKINRACVSFFTIIWILGAIVLFSNGKTGSSIGMGILALLGVLWILKMNKQIAKQTKEKENNKYNEYTDRFRKLYALGKEKEIQDWIKQYAPSSEHEMAAKVLQVVLKEYEEAQREEEESKALLEKYRVEYGDEIVESYQKRTIKFGMPQQMIIDIYGEPADIKKERTEKTLSETYYYAKNGEKYISGKTSTYKIRVDFKNAIVKGYKEY